jgi:large subunit ribosomal protein L30
MTVLEITLKRGLVGKPGTQRRVVEALGLSKYGSSVKHAKSDTIVGMVKKVHHLVTVKEHSGTDKEKSAAKKSSGKPAKQTAI